MTPSFAKIFFRFIGKTGTALAGVVKSIYTTVFPGQTKGQVIAQVKHEREQQWEGRLSTPPAGSGPDDMEPFVGPTVGIPE